jgi:membrane protein
MSVPRPLRAVGRLLAEAFADWQNDNAPRLGAALAFYTLFSLAPLLIVAIALAGLVFGREAAQGQIVAELRDLLGDTGARAVEEMVQRSRQPESGILATATALFTLLLGASGVFGELKSALNEVWDAKPAASGGLLRLARERVASFAMVLVVGFILLVSLLLNAALAAADGALRRLFPGPISTVLQVSNDLLSLVWITALFALLFKFLPDTRIAWGDVWMGALITSLLFTVGKFGIGLYLGRSSFSSVYGAAGSIVVLIVWVYYAAQVFLYGAEVAHVYSRRRGSRSAAPSGAPGGPAPATVAESALPAPRHA